MNIRLGSGGVRLRLSEAELSLLAQGQPVSEELQLGLGAFEIAASPAPADGVELTGSGVRLRLSAATLQRLADLGRSKHGIGWTDGAAAISVEVDLKRDRPSKVIP